MSDLSIIRCRVKKSKACLDGREAEPTYGGGDMGEDGTYDEATNTVVCDPCYIAIGQPGIPIDHPDARTFGRNIGKGDPR